MESRVQQLPLAPPPLPPAIACGNIDNFCGDCGVMFESNTSLQVHLTYHKENLLSRWAPTTTTASQGQIPSTITTTTPKMESKSEPQPPPASSPISSHYVSQAHFGQNFPHFQQPIHFLPQQNQFSPNQLLHQHHQFDDGRMGPPHGRVTTTKERLSGEQPAEILDLDSNRVHLYNIQQEQQTFYRPYLMTTQAPPPPLSGVGNGWPHVTAPSSVDTHYSPGPLSYHPQDLYNRNPLPPPQMQNIVYNYVQQESAYAPPPPLAGDQGPMSFQPPQQQQPEPQVVPPRQRDVSSPAQPPPAQVKKEVKGGGGEGEMMRGKGKGGACKRPKAYECTSCNKWFTSSGHLKRHYGTTLHKNSAQQNGSEGTEAAIGPGRGKGKKSKKQKMDVPNASIIGGLLVESNSPRPMSTPIVEPPKSIGNGNGLADEIPPQYAPPPPHPQQQQHQQQPTTYFYLGDTHNPMQHHPQFFPHFDGAGGVYTNAHPPIPVPSIYSSSGNGGYPTMEVPLPPFSTVTASHYVAEVTTCTYQDQNGNGVMRAVEGNNGGNSPEPALKKEPTEESPEVGRGMSPHSSASWLSPCPGETSENSSNGGGNSPSSSGNDSETHRASAEGEEKQLIHCPHCTKTFTRTCYLTQHKNSNHSPEEKHFKCPLCGKKFSLEPALSEHVSKHDGGSKPHKCPYKDCTKDFNHKTDLRRHFCHHTGTKPFTCEDCGKGFIRKDHMTKHSEIHRRNPPPPRSAPLPIGGPHFGSPPRDSL